MDVFVKVEFSRLIRNKPRGLTEHPVLASLRREIKDEKVMSSPLERRRWYHRPGNGVLEGHDDDFAGKAVPL